MKKALITGVTGQSGSYLAELLLKKGYDVHGIIRRSSSINTKRIDHIYHNPNLTLHYGDMTDSLSLDGIIHLVKPDELYHLAAQSHVYVSFKVPEYTGQVDAMGTLKLLEAVKKHAPECRVYNACTSELYGDVLETPQSEKTPFNPQSPYAIAKQYSFWIAKNYRNGYNMFISNGILFNHESERRGETFVTKKITQAFANILYNRQKVLELGNLNAKRDWGYAPDYVEGMWMMLQQDKPDDFVLATNETHTIKEFVEKTIDAINDRISYKQPIDLEWQGEGENEIGYCKNRGEIIRVNPRYFRPTEVDILLGDYSKAKNTFGWEPKTTFNKLVEKMIIYDLNKIENVYY